MEKFLIASAVGLALALASCTSTNGEDGSDAGTNDAGPGDPNVLVGRFLVKRIAPVAPDGANAGSAGHTSVVGKVYDGPTPSAIVWETAATEGDCVLVKPRVPFCATPCGGSAVCVEDDTCRPYPTARAAGAVEVSGIRTAAGATTFSMQPIGNAYQPSADVALPFDAFAENDPIRIAAAGTTAVAPFSIEARAIAPLVLATEPITLDGQPVSIRWDPPGTQGISRIAVKLDVSHHGGTRGMITCDTADDGALELSASLVTQLTNLGVAGFPTIVVTRSGSGSTVIAAGRVDLTVTSEVEKAVVIPGVESCTDDADCPQNKACRSDLTCG